jgi:hypothetical protein
MNTIESRETGALNKIIKLAKDIKDVKVNADILTEYIMDTWELISIMRGALLYAQTLTKVRTPSPDEITNAVNLINQSIGKYDEHMKKWPVKKITE